MADITFAKPTFTDGVSQVSAATFQPFADALDKVTHLANRGGAILDADTVSGYGIGVQPSYSTATNLDTGFLVGGMFAINESVTTGGTWTGITKTGYGTLIVSTAGQQSYGFIQYYTPIDNENCYRRYRDSGGTWRAWVKVWDAGNDGNGGQPPSAKSNKTSNSTIGWFDSVDCASGARVTLPSSGTFEWFVTTYGATYNSVKSGISAGGLMTGTASANLTMQYKRLS